MIDVETFKQIVKDKYITVTYGVNGSESGKFLRIECNCIVLELNRGGKKYIVIDSIVDFQEIPAPLTEEERDIQSARTAENLGKAFPSLPSYKRR